MKDDRVPGDDFLDLVFTGVNPRGRYSLRATQPGKQPFGEATQDLVEAELRQIAGGICAASGCVAEVDYQRKVPPTVNTPEETRIAAEVARELLDEKHLVLEPQPSMGSEDFAFFLRARPGCYFWLGSGTREDRAGLHSPRYDFNDEILPLGAAFWCGLAERFCS